MGVRVIKGDNTKDIPLAQMNNYGLTFDKCNGSIEIKTQEKKYTYDEVYKYNSKNKGLIQNCSIEQYSFADDTCRILSDGNVIDVNIYELVDAIANNRCYVTNLSKIKLWRNFV